MAEEWIKVERRTMNKPALYDIAEQCDADILAVRGACVTFWCWADENCDDDRTGLTPSTLDRLIGLRGFADALVSVGWARIGEDCRVHIEKYEEHNSNSAKSRANGARRQNKCRANKKAASVTGKSRTCHAESVTESGRERDLEEERELEEENIPSMPIQRYVAEAADATPRRESARPSDADEVAAVMRQQVNCQLSGRALDELAIRFFSEMSAVGWVDKNGLNIWNWKAAAVAYMCKWQHIANNPGAGRQGSQPKRKDCNDPSRYRRNNG